MVTFLAGAGEPNHAVRQQFRRSWIIDTMHETALNQLGDSMIGVQGAENHHRDVLKSCGNGNRWRRFQR